MTQSRMWLQCRKDYIFYDDLLWARTHC